jgi:hypothetical protein
MKKNLIPALALLALLAFSCSTPPEEKPEVSKSNAALSDPLPSWQDGATKQSIVDFVTRTTTEGSGDFIPAGDRIACFDNDGTLWSEQPVYFQLAFAIDRIKAMAVDHPEWKTKQPYKALLEGDLKAVMAGGEHALLEIVMASHSGMTADAFRQEVKDWMSTATHPKTGKPYTGMIYQPMLELLNYLRANGYKTFIVSGGGIDFMRAWTESTYGIPAEQVVGSFGKVKYEVVDGKGVLTKLPELAFIDDKAGKPVGIYQFIGRRPVFAAGNSDGDYAMLQYTTTGTGPRFGLLVHHTDSVREVAYDSLSAIGNLKKGLVDAPAYHWVIADMKNDWKQVFPE